MAVRLTQEYVEALVQLAPTVRLTWLGTEVLITGSPTVRLTQLYVEVLTPSSSIYDRTVDSTLVPTQNIVCNIVKNLSVTSTLVPTQDILAYNQLLVESELDLTQDIVATKVISRDVTSTLTITQEVAKVIPLEVTSTLTMTDDPDAIKQKMLNHSSTLTLTHTRDLNKILNRRIDSNIFLTHSILRQMTWLKEITSTLTLIQNIIATNSKAVKSTLTFTQDIDFEMGKLVRHTLEYTQTLERQLTANRSMISLFEPYQQINRNVLYNLTTSNTLTFTQQIIAYVAKQVTSILNLSQTIEVLRVKHVQNSLEYSQTILLNQVRNLTQSDTLDMFQELSCNKVYFRAVSNVLGFEQTLRSRKAYLREVTNTFVIGQEVYRTRYNETVTSTFAPSNVITKTWVANRLISQTLTLTQAIGQNNIYSRTITSTLTFLREFRIRIGDYDYILPTLYVAKAQRYTVMTGGMRTIVLPNPELGDAEANTGKFSLRRGMAGKVFTYVKKTNFRKLNYTFHVGRTKAKELMDFIIENNTNVVTITTFKGDTWFVYITTNPNDMITQSRFATDCDPDQSREKVSVTLEFEGVKIGSPIA